jgi:hypothetical protein
MVHYHTLRRFPMSSYQELSHANLSSWTPPICPTYNGSPLTLPLGFRPRTATQLAYPAYEAQHTIHEQLAFRGLRTPRTTEVRVAPNAMSPGS